MDIQMHRRIPILEGPSNDQAQSILEILKTSDNVDGWMHQSEQSGLFCIYAPNPEDVEIAQHTHDLDIVAIHGLGGDAYRTWQHENGFNWLQHLHEALPGVRVFSYGYDSGAAFWGGTASLTDHARHLLTLLRTKRQSEMDRKRKIVLVGHSMGGLLAKQAFLIASNERGLFEPVRESICAMLFLATPHSGSRSKSYTDVLCGITDAVLFPTPAETLLESFRNSLIETLRSNIQVLYKLADTFRSEAYAIPQISSFVETSPLPDVEGVSVDMTSGYLGTSGERVVPMLGHDHRQVCKHPSLECLGMKMILAELRDAANRQLRESPQPNHTCPRDPASIQASAKKFQTDSLLTAVASGNITAVSRLLNNGVDINAHGHDQRSPLHLACQHGHRALCALLLDKGADLKATDNQGSQPLHLAAARGDHVQALLLLKRGANPNIKDKNECTPLHRAAESGDEVTIQALLDHGSEWITINKSGELPVRVARKARHIGAMKLLQKQMESVGEAQQAFIQFAGRIPRSGLLTARERTFGSRSVFDAEIIYLDDDADLKENASRLAQRAAQGDLEAVEYMLDLGTEPKPDALYLAATESRSDIAEVLADVMDDIDASVGTLGTALCAAACNEHGHNTLRVLLERGANVNWQGGKYGCALQAAVANHRLENVKLLLRCGADANAQCGHYGNALTAAARHRTHFEEMAALLLEYGADIDAQGPGKYGNPLQTAVYLKSPERVRFLLQRGASRVARGRFGSALEIAQEHYEAASVSEREAEEDILMMLTEEVFVGSLRDTLRGGDVVDWFARSAG